MYVFDAALDKYLFTNCIISTMHICIVMLKPIVRQTHEENYNSLKLIL